MSVLSLRQLVLLKNSLIFASGTTLLTLIFGLPLGFLIERTNLPFRKLFRILVFIPLLIPPYLHAIAWRFAVLLLQRTSSLQISLYNLTSAITIMSLAYFPIVTLLVIFALRNQDQRMEEAALLFTSRWRIFRRITVPLLGPAILAGMFFVFILSLTNFGIPSLLHVNVFVYEIFSQFSAFFDTQEAFILTGPLLSATFLLAFLFYLVIRNRPLLTVASGVSPSRVIQLGMLGKIWGLGYVFILLFTSLVIPLGTFFVQTGSIKNLVFALSSSWEVIGKSLFLSFLGASLVSGLTAIFSICLLMYQLKWERKILRLTTVLLLALPSITVGVLLIKIFNRPSLSFIYTSFGVILIGYLFRFSPYASEIMNAFVRQIDPKLIEVSKLSGASNVQILLKILLPLLTPALAAAWLVVFFLSLTELGTTVLVHPPDWQTLPIRIFILMHYGAPELVAALSLILIGVSIVPIGFLMHLLSIRRHCQFFRAKL